MAKKKAHLTYTVDKVKAMEIIASCTPSQRRDKRLELGRIIRLADLSEEQACFFFGECIVFSQISHEVNEWIDVNFVAKGGTVRNYARMSELYQFYLALTSDVDIRYDLERQADDDYEVTNTSIVGNDFYIERQ